MRSTGTGHKSGSLISKSLYSFRESDHPAFGIFEGELAHAIELIFHWHGDLCAVLLHSLEEIFELFDFNEQSEAAADGLGAESGIVLSDGFLVVEENLHAVRCYGAEDIRRRVRDREAGLKAEHVAVEIEAGFDVANN